MKKKNEDMSFQEIEEDVFSKYEDGIARLDQIFLSDV